MLHSTSVTGLLALASLLASANGHMIMKSPPPMGIKSLNNSPLDASGSDFPCKQRDGVYDMTGTTVTSMAIGESQTLSFTGSAVHGGGSCQISLSSNQAPDQKTNDWFVIHSIEGGCPANTAGNLPADPSGSGASTFQFKIPDGVTPGKYTLAWTWFNKIGNREMYMNCAAIEVTGAKKKRYAPTTPSIEKRASFPAMAVANLASVNSCKTTETVDVLFAQPGDSVDKICTSTCGNMVGDSCTVQNAAPNQAAPASGSSSGSSGSGSSGSSGSAPSASASAPLTQSSPGVFATVSSAPAASSPAAASSAPEAPTQASSASTPAPTGASSGGSSSSGSGSATQNASCSTEGQTDCAADGQSYLICASGYWQKMSVAAGTQCQAGVSDSIRIAAIPINSNKRDHLRRHLHRGSIH